MKIGELKDQIKDFKPFTIYMTDGFQIHIPHIDYIYFPPIGRSFVVIGPNGGVHVLASEHVTRTDHGNIE
ncbi:MAG TPA: hypothetical protein VF849_01405 [Blattabacteriaceae bacterium]